MPAIPFAVLMAPRQAQASWIAAALAIGAIVAGMVANHNRRGGGAILASTNEKLDVVIDQVASLQQAVALALDKLAGITGEVDALLRQENVRQKQLAVQAAVMRYQDKIQVIRPNYPTLEALQAQLGVRLDLQAVLNDLYGSVSMLDLSKAYGPNAALVMPSAFLLEQSLLLMRGDPSRDIALRLERTMMWFDKVADVSEPNSAASYRNQAARRLDLLREEGMKTAYGKALGMSAGSTLFDAVGLDDYTGGQTRRRCVRSRFEDPASFEDDTAPPWSRPHFLGEEPVGQLSKAAFDCDDVPIPDRIGPRDRIFGNLVLEEHPVPVPASAGFDGGVADFTVPILRKTAPSEVMADGDPRLPSRFRVVTKADMRDGNQRTQWLRQQIETSPRNAEIAALQQILDRIGEERARISYATASLKVMSEARPMFDQMISKLKA